MYSLLFLSFLWLTPPFVVAAPAPSIARNDPYQLPPIVAVENRQFNPRHDLSLGVGILPLDAFYKSYSYGLSYTYGWKEFLRWEAINASLCSSQDTGLKQELLDKFRVQPTGILDSVRWMMTSNVVYTPIYSKNLLFNRSIVHGEFSGVAGAGLVGWSSGESAPMLGGGLIVRFFKSETLSFKFDNRLYYHFGKNKSSDLLLAINLGLSFELSKTNEKK